jgi:hypothetical protein
MVKNVALLRRNQSIATPRPGGVGRVYDGRPTDPADAHNVIVDQP